MEGQRERDATTRYYDTRGTTSTVCDELKPKWFYDTIGILAKMDEKVYFTEAWNAILVEEVNVDVLIENDYVDYIDGMYGRGIHMLDRQEVTVTIEDHPPPHIEKRFTDTQFKVEPATTQMWLSDYGEQKYKPWLMFKSMYESVPFVTYTFTGGRHVAQLNHERWKPDGQWYFVNADKMNWRHNPSRRTQNIW